MLAPRLKPRPVHRTAVHISSPATACATGAKVRLPECLPIQAGLRDGLARQLEARADREFEAGRVSSSLDALGEAETLAREAFTGTSEEDPKFAGREATLQRILSKLEQRK